MKIRSILINFCSFFDFGQEFNNIRSVMIVKGNKTYIHSKLN